MSTEVQARIKELEAAGLLVRYMPRVPKRPMRRLFLGPDALKDLMDPQSATNLLVGKGFIISALDRWTLGEKVYGKKRGEFLDRLKPPPPEVWEIRVTAPRPQARLFGRFAEPDTLILTKFHTRSMLGNKGSEPWNQAMAHCEKCWNTHFASIPPFSADSIKAYVTENCDGFPI
jgi:hypothetical protein